MLSVVLTEAMDQCFISMRFPDKHPFGVIELIHYAVLQQAEMLPVVLADVLRRLIRQ